MEEYITNAFTRTEDQTNLEVNNLNVTCITSTDNKFNLDSEGNLTVKSITTEVPITSESTTPSTPSQLDMSMIYPVGSIYMSVNNVSPSTLFGGTWEQIKDKFLLSCGDTYTAGATGGEATHVLTTNEMPQHTHIQNAHSHTQNYHTWYNDASNYDVRLASSSGGYHGMAGTYGYATQAATAVNQNTGGSQAHNNMPPYLAVYMWKRIA